VGGDAVLTCDPFDVEAMAGLMERIVSDRGLRDALVARGKSRLAQFSWDRSAKALLDACQRVSDRADAPITPLPLRAGERPLVSIVTPSMNQGRFLRRTIESVLTQTYPRVEYIVIDGGSTDESIHILQSYGRRLRWISEPDGGQTHAINKGMAIASGEVVSYVNSDDVLLPDAVERVVGYFQHHPDWDMLYGNADYIDENDRVTGAYATDEYSFDRLLADCMICQPAAFWQRRIAERVGPFDERLHYAMDYDYWMRIDRAGGRIQFVADKLAQSRLHKDAKTLTARARIFRECIDICDRHAGQVGLDFFNGYWHHLVHERQDLASRILRRLPLDHMDLAWLHHRWHHGVVFFARELSAYLASQFALHLGLDWNRIRAQWSGPSGMPLLPKESSRVRGVYVDGWLAPNVTIEAGWAAPGATLHLAGKAKVDGTVAWDAGGTELGRQHVKVGDDARITVSADTLSGRPLNIRFSNFILDAKNRQLSFALQDTNLFSETDIA
jgi:glycosyltransferase involved in cell wall biosynthesis